MPQFVAQRPQRILHALQRGWRQSEGAAACNGLPSDGWRCLKRSSKSRCSAGMTDLFTRRGVCASLLSLGACSTRPSANAPRTLAANKLTIGTYFVNPPFEYISDGERVGFEVDLMNEIALRLTLTPVFVDTEWEKILQEMQARQ